MSKGRTHSETHRQQSKITKLVLLTERQLKTMIIIKAILLEDKNYSFCLSFFSRSWKKFWYLYLKMPHLKTPYHIDFLASMDSLWIITLYTQIHRFCDNRSQTFWGYISMKNFFKKCLTWSKIPRISPLRLFNVASSLKKLCQAVVGRNDQANFQKTLNEGARGASFTIFWLLVD